MSALPPKADIEMGAALRLLVTQSGRSVEYAVQQTGNLSGLPLVVPYEATNGWDSHASGVFAVDVALGRSDQHDCGHTILLVFQRGRCTVLAALH